MIADPGSAPTHAGSTPLERRLQIAFVVGVWLFACGLHWRNDGLWVTDATRHAANGLFWKDFLVERPSDPKGFVLSYFARYPVINPSAYPPLFYFLEAAAFAAFGAAPHVAKSLVLVGSLATGLYTTAGIRRYVSTGLAPVGSIVMLAPGMLLWSHAVMLNVPSVAIGVAALYYARRALEVSHRPGGRSLHVLTLALCLASFLTYYTAGVVIPIAIAWVIAWRGRQTLRSRWVPHIMLAGAIVLGAVTFLSIRLAPAYVILLIPQREKITSLENWTYYARLIPGQFGLLLPSLSAAGLACGIALRRWRSEVTLMAIWVIVAYLMFSVIRAREGRYILTIGPPFVILAAVALATLEGALARLTRSRPIAVGRLVAGFIALGLVGVQAAHATRVPVPSVRGIQEVADFLGEVAPGESYFYEGSYDGIFAYYVRAGDPDFRNRVVTGKKLLYAFAQNPTWRLRQYVSTTDEVVDRLREEGGCRWLAIEDDFGPPQVAATRLLREAVAGGDFEFVRSFPIGGRANSINGEGPRRVDVYRLLGPLRAVDEVDLPFPILGPDVVFRVKPIPTRGGRARRGN